MHLGMQIGIHMHAQLLYYFVCVCAAGQLLGGTSFTNTHLIT